MKKVKGIQGWIEGYNEMKTLADELELAFDFYKDELVTEAEVDENYAKAVEMLENLEMITIEQLKDVKERTDALRRYL